MKVIAFFLITCCFTKAFNQTIPIVQAYNVLGTKDIAPYQLKYDIVNDKPNWQAFNVDDATDVKLYITANGKYLQISDAGSGPSKTVVQCKILSTKNGKSVIAINTTVYTIDSSKLNSVKFFEVDEFGGKKLKNFLPKLTPLYFIAKQDLAGQQEMYMNGEVLYQLNETNNNIEVTAYFKALKQDCMAGSKAACQAQNVVQPAITLSWSAALKKYTTTKRK